MLLAADRALLAMSSQTADINKTERYLAKRGERNIHDELTAY